MNHLTTARSHTVDDVNLACPLLGDAGFILSTGGIWAIVEAVCDQDADGFSAENAGWAAIGRNLLLITVDYPILS